MFLKVYGQLNLLQTNIPASSPVKGGIEFIPGQAGGDGAAGAGAHHADEDEEIDGVMEVGEGSGALVEGAQEAGLDFVGYGVGF